MEKSLMLLPLQVSADGIRCLLRLSGLLLRACEGQTLPTALQVGILRPGVGDGGASAGSVQTL